MNQLRAACADLGNAVKNFHALRAIFWKYWAYLCNIYMITFSLTRRLRISNFYHIYYMYLFRNKYKFNLTPFLNVFLCFTQK